MTRIDLEAIQRHPASFRDPAGTVFNIDNRIIRGLSEKGAKQYQTIRQSGFLNTLEDSQRIVKTMALEVNHSDAQFSQWIEHTKIPFISYPYEWPFLLLKEAALFHLNLQLDALASDFVLTDASAYNIQFQGVSPIFIDILSFKKYEPGALWKGHRQFCEQFLNPLLLSAVKGIPYQAWYRGALHGIPMNAMAQLLPLRYWLSIKALTHILLPLCFQSTKQNNLQRLKKINQATIPKTVYRNLLNQLYRWIESLKPPKNRFSVWGDYALNAPYESNELAGKKQFIAEFSTKNTPQFLLDLGCNNGEFAEIALRNGASQVIGFDLCPEALNKAVIRAQQKHLHFLPLYQEVTNPSPAQGWLLMERDRIALRGTPDAIIALAFIHHLVIGHNIVFKEAIAWLLSLAPRGIIEFIPKTDPTVQRMLALREDIFPDYTPEIFTRLLQECAIIIKSEIISASGRCLYWYERSNCTSIRAISE